MKKIAIFIASIFVVFSGYFISPVPLAHAQTNAVSTGQLTGQTNIEQALSSGCSIIDNFSLCVLSFVYHVILGVSFWAVALVANIFDFFLGYTLNSSAYQSDFIVKGWGVIRDIANVAFIFTLLYLAIRHILGMSAFKYIPTLILVAVLLNFSLFFTRVVVDAGNILARAFYQSINIENDEYSEESGYRGISAALVDKIDPQRLLSEAMFTQQLTTGDFSTTTGAPVNPAVSSPAYASQNLEDNLGFYVAIFLLLAFVNFSLAGIFLSVALLMVGRTIGLWFAMIFSPIAFITLAVPGSGGFVKQLSFDTWKDTVLKLSFLAPIFIFFLYLTIMFLTVFFETPIPVENQDTFMRIMAVFIPFMFVITILRISKKTAEDMAGEIGGTVKSLVGKALGAVGGAALGGAAFAGRAVGGRIASSRLRNGNYNERIGAASQRLEEAKQSGNRMLQLKAMADIGALEASKKSLQKMKESTWDVRNAPKAKGLIGRASGVIGGTLATGMKDFGGDKMTFGKGDTESRKKYEEEKSKEKLKKAEDISKVETGELPETIMRLHRAGDSADKIIEKTNLDYKINNLRNDVDKIEASEEPNLEELKIKNKELRVLEDIKEGVINNTQTKDLEKFIKDGKGDYRGTKNITSDRRGYFANRIQVDPLYRATTGGNEYMADAIRKGNTVKSEKDKALDALKNLMKEEEKPKDEAKPEPEKPKEEDKK